MENVEGKVVLITGASSGIGEATARLLADEGAKVMLAARREERLQQLKQDIESKGGTAEYKVTDVTNRDEVMALGQATIDKFGGIDVLFNNAGLMPLSMMEKLHIDEWDRMIDVNIKGLLYAIAAVLPQMRKQNSGQVINVSSVAGHFVFPGSAVYSGTKFAVWAISEGLRKEVGKDIRVCTISPGAIETELPTTITDGDIKQGMQDVLKLAIDPYSIARAVRHAIAEPADVDVNEIIVRPTAQEL